MEKEIVSTSLFITLSVVIPAYNEDKNIGKAIYGIIANMPEKVVEYELIVVDDGSNDDTAIILSDIAAQNMNVRVVSLPTNQGKGSALITGLKYARMEWVLFADADLQIDMKELNLFLEYTDNYDLIIGYRKIRGDSILRRFLSKGYSLLIWILLDIRLNDLNCPFKLIRRSFLNNINLNSHGFFIDTELVYSALLQKGYIIELGVKGNKRENGISSVKFWHFFEVIKELFVLLKKTKKVF